MKIKVNFSRKFMRWGWFQFPSKMLAGKIKFYTDSGDPVAMFDCVSGGWGRRPIDRGLWRIAGVFSSDSFDKCYQGAERRWYIRLDPQFKTDQTGILFHPDQPPKGTKGCIGLDVSVDEKFYQLMLNEYKYKRVSLIEVVYSDESL